MEVNEIIGRSEAINRILVKVSQVAATDATALILGETGTGKGLIAHAIHRLSRRNDRPLVKVDCTVLPDHLIESELFGHEKGSFTGASSAHKGWFELGDGGTIFLDEIGELPIHLQPKLLRALECGEFERLGSSRAVKVDVRIIAATNVNLQSAVDYGTFRADLYYRLSTFPITIPPLRERRDDIPLLVSSFVNTIGARLGKNIEIIPPEVMDQLRQYSWPGNVRELENVIERAMINTHGNSLQLAVDLSPAGYQSLAVNLPASSQCEQSPLARMETLEEVERNYIIEVLEKCGWRISGKNGASQVLGLNPNTLRFRMNKLGIHRPKIVD